MNFLRIIRSVPRRLLWWIICRIDGLHQFILRRHYPKGIWFRLVYRIDPGVWVLSYINIATDEEHIYKRILSSGEAGRIILHEEKRLLVDALRNQGIFVVEES